MAGGEGARYGKPSREVKAQIRRELELIGRLGFSGYFLIVWDLVKFCRDNDILVQGRGSAANSAVCFCLGITPVDPVGAKLLFERFLSEGRKSWPDIDLDLPSGERRERVIQEVYRRYGRHGAAMTANVITYAGAARSARSERSSSFPRRCWRASATSTRAGITAIPSSLPTRSRSRASPPPIPGPGPSRTYSGRSMDCPATSDSIPAA